jgi:hypothetical protein
VVVSLDNLIKIDLADSIRAASDLLDKLGVVGLVATVLDVPNTAVQRWQSQNFIRFYDKFMKERADREADGRPAIPPALLIPSIRRILDESDDDMLGLWAKLIAGFAETNHEDGSRKVFSSLLSEMTPIDAKVLVFLFSKAAFDLVGRGSGLPGGAEDHCVSLQQVSENVGVGASRIVLSLGNLCRLACLMATTPDSIIIAEDREFVMVGHEGPGTTLYTPAAIYYPTPLARGLLEALRVGPAALNGAG